MCFGSYDVYQANDRAVRCAYVLLTSWLAGSRDVALRMGAGKMVGGLAVWEQNVTCVITTTISGKALGRKGKAKT